MATHSSILAWKIPWAEEPGGLLSMELQSVNMSEQLSSGNDGQGSLACYSPWDRKELDTTERLN